MIWYMLRLKYQKNISKMSSSQSEKKKLELSSKIRIRDDGLRFTLYQEMQIQIPPGSRQVMQMRIIIQKNTRSDN